MRIVAACLAPVVLSGCMEAATVADAGTHEVQAGRQLLVFFESGFDEPPTGGIIRSCDTSPEGLCVVQGSDSYPLIRAGDVWTYQDIAASYALASDGTGQMSALESDYGIGVSWMTEPWS